MASLASQQAQILSRLRRGDRLTPKDARERVGCDRLAARICELRQAGHVINRDWHHTDDGARVAEYWMPKEAR